MDLLLQVVILNQTTQYFWAMTTYVNSRDISWSPRLEPAWFSWDSHNIAYTVRHGHGKTYIDHVWIQ